MSREPLSRERLISDVKEMLADPLMVWEEQWLDREQIAALLAAAERVAALEGLLRRVERDLFLLFGVDKHEVSFLVANNIRMEMERRKQKIVRELLAALRAENGGGE